MNFRELATVCAYRLDNELSPTKIEEARQMDGSAKWAVRRRGDCLSAEGLWEWEPMPSGRDDEFLARCRFDSPEAAFEAWKRRSEERMPF